MFHRGSRGFRRRSGPRPVVRTYKKIINFAPASYAAGFNNQVFLTGVDSVAIGQTSVTDGNCPTGSKMKYVEVQFCVSNVVSVATYVNCTLQYKLAGQSFVSPDTQGGDPQRNQTLHMDLFSVGSNQNSTHKFKFKIPGKFQRIRDGMQWSLTWSNNNTVNNKTQIIYKVEL